MKRMIYTLLLFFCTLAATAGQSGLIRIYTDKDCYLAGEKMWIKLSLDEQASPENRMSTVAYVEISDETQIHAQAKVSLREGTGWACVSLPASMHSGVYRLMTYTRYMRNWDTSCYPQKFLAVVNARAHGESDKLKAEAVPALSDLAESPVVGLESSQASYGMREKVTLQWPSEWADARDLVLSVVRKDSEVTLPASPEPVAPVTIQGEQWVAECEGHIVTARPRKAEVDVPVGLSAQLGCVGKELHVFEGVRKADGTFRFYTNGVVNQQDVVLVAANEGGATCQLEVVSPFVEQLPQALPDLQLRYQEEALADRSVAVQINQAIPPFPIVKPMDETLFGQQPSKTYNLDEYVRFSMVQDCITEFVMGVTISKEGGKRVIRQLQEESKDYNMFPVLVLIDGVPFDNHEDVITYSAKRLHYIHQYRGNYVLGDKIYGGVLSLVTHTGHLPDIRIPQNMQMQAYEFPQDHPAFVAPAYPTEEAKQSRYPDLRHTLYWNPSAQGTNQAEFYTSDMKGIYVATLQGVSARGETITATCSFEVK